VSLCLGSIGVLISIDSTLVMVCVNLKNARIHRNHYWYVNPSWKVMPMSAKFCEQPGLICIKTCLLKNRPDDCGLHSSIYCLYYLIIS
jgi:hypothetical protein